MPLLPKGYCQPVTQPASRRRLLLLLTLALLAAATFACSSTKPDGDAAPAVQSPTPAAAQVPPAQPTLVSLATAVPPTQPPLGATATAAPPGRSPPSDTRCGQSLLSPGDPQATALQSLPGRIVFICRGQVWTMLPDGSQQKRITAYQTIDWDHVRLDRVPEYEPPKPGEREALENAMNSSPRWLAGGRIVFASIRDLLRLSAASPETAPRQFVGATELYTINPDGRGEFRVTDFNLKPGSYTGRFGFDPSNCAGPNFCHAGLLNVEPYGTARTQDLIAAGVVEIRFSECCFYSSVVKVNAGGVELLPSIDPIAALLPESIYGVDWSADDKSLLLTIGTYDSTNRFATDLRPLSRWPIPQHRQGRPRRVSLPNLRPIVIAGGQAGRILQCRNPTTGRGPIFPLPRFDRLRGTSTHPHPTQATAGAQPARHPIQRQPRLRPTLVP